MKPYLIRLRSFGAATIALATISSAQSFAQAPNAGGGGAAAALASCETDLVYLNQITGWQASWPRQWATFGAGDDQEKQSLIKTWSKADEALASDIAALRKGISRGTTAPAPVVARILEQVTNLHDQVRSDVPGINHPLTDQWDQEWSDLFDETIVPALARYRDFLTVEYAPLARRSPGLSDLPNGAECFSEAIEFWTSLDLESEEIERRGRAILDESKRDLLSLMKREPDELSDVLEELRAPYSASPFSSDDLVALSTRAIERAEKAAPTWFLKPLDERVVVAPMSAHIQDSAPAGYYTPPPGDGAPAAYVINLSRPAERRLMAEVIAIHETVPGHHMNLTYPRTGNEAGRFNSGFAEGWAIYSEYLADEMGLFSSDYDRAGMIAKHLWAASRLVIEPGLHMKGWSRQQAIDFMLSNSAMSPHETAMEVDRYMAMPGQSLSYMLGYLAFRDMREAAEAELSDDFDIRAFHDVVLGGGVRSLGDTRKDVEKWVKSAG